MKIVICVVFFAMGFVCGMYASSQLEKYIDKNIKKK